MGIKITHEESTLGHAFIKHTKYTYFKSTKQLCKKIENLMIFDLSMHVHHKKKKKRIKAKILLLYWTSSLLNI